MFLAKKVVGTLSLILIMGLLIAAQCGSETDSTQGGAESSTGESAPKGRLQVVATTSIIGDWVQQVGGEAINLTIMLPPGVDPHTFTPTPQDAVLVAEADVIFRNGLNLEPFLDSLLKNTGGAATVISVSKGIEPLEHIEGEGNQHHHDVDHPDPHVWTTPFNAITMVGHIQLALSELDPAQASLYGANAAAYQSELETLDKWVQTQIETIPAENRKLVTDHDTFAYYADRYGLEIIGAVIPAYSTSAEPSAQEIARLQEAIDAFEVQAVFVSITFNATLAERVAEDMDIQLVPLYTGSLGEPGSGVESYLDYIRYNTKAIVEALKPDKG